MQIGVVKFLHSQPSYPARQHRNNPLARELNHPTRQRRNYEITGTASRSRSCGRGASRDGAYAYARVSSGVSSDARGVSNGAGDDARDVSSDACARGAIHAVHLLPLRQG
jgi:hypothetical protein